MYSVSQFQSVRICQIILTADMPLLWIFWIPRFSFDFWGWVRFHHFSWLFCVLHVYFSPSIFDALLIFVVVFFYGQWLIPQECLMASYIHWKLIIENLYSSSLFSVGETWRVIKQVQVSELNISTCRRGIKSAFKTHWHISGSAIKRCALLGLNALSQG